MAKTHILGFPRIGEFRELKKALDAYWKSNITQEQLLDVGKEIKYHAWRIQAEAGLDFITVGDFSFYDHILDTSALLGVVPSRFQQGTEFDLDTIFTMGRGQSPGKNHTTALAMTKWFNTNYHYMVPEFNKNQQFSLLSDKVFNEVDEAQALGYKVKPVLVGPLTYLWLGKENDTGFSKLELLPQLIDAYIKILHRLQSKNINYVQVDEPILTLDLPKDWQEAFVLAYNRLKLNSLNIILTTYFGDLGDNLSFIKNLPVHGLHIDICSAPKQLITIANEWPRQKILSVGLINGRNVWKNNLSNSLEMLEQLTAKFGDNLWISSSCSLLHTPVDLDNESKLNPEIKNWLAFAKQKVNELALLGKGVNSNRKLIEEQLALNQKAIDSRKTSTLIHDQQVQSRIKSLESGIARRNSDFNRRIKTQIEKLDLPLFPTTTIGSFPQTTSIRKIRQEYNSGKLSHNKYIEEIKQEIKMTVARQESLGLDVLVHGEAERNDMVEYFGELLNGFAFTQNGWVQSYGSRCVKPPLIYGDISRSKAMTIEWISYAKSLTKKEVKGMLTGPVTILSWSFVRDDQPHQNTALQIALALRDEVSDLEKAGINIIQIDEPAFREALPLKKRDWQQYLDWAVYVFRVCSSGVADSTQIHTHMCYSSFNDIIQAIADLDADVITIETSRSNLELLKVFETFNYPNQIGPGVYDIHSPRMPDSNEIIQQVEKMLKYIPVEKLWINPDCGLKTREWPEVEKALQNMQKAAIHLREVSRL